MDYRLNSKTLLNGLDKSHQYWLHEAKNLVSSLKNYYGEIKLKKVSQGFSEIHDFEKEFLSTEKALVRQITLNSESKTLVFARTILPKKTYAFFTDEMDNLGEKPIGDNLLFNENFARGDFIIRKLSKQNFYHETGLTSDKDIYSRSSIFTYRSADKLTFLITEYFLDIIKTNDAK